MSQPFNFDLKKLTKTHPKVIIITGKTGGGKTSFLSKLITVLQAKGISISGFLAKRTSDSASFYKYQIRFLDTNETVPLSSRKKVGDWYKVAHFYFNPEAILMGNRILNDPQILNKDLIVIDEIGIFEMEGKIWADAISHLVSKSEKMMIWVVRDTLVEKVIEKWNLQKPVIIDIQKVSIRQAEEKILSMFEIH
jgi:nucleoside-triphosphatase